MRQTVRTSFMIAIRLIAALFLLIIMIMMLIRIMIWDAITQIKAYFKQKVR